LGRCKEEEKSVQMEFGVGGGVRGVTWYFIGMIRKGKCLEMGCLGCYYGNLLNIPLGH
jgi:hypothetical protein